MDTRYSWRRVPGAGYPQPGMPWRVLFFQKKWQLIISKLKQSIMDHRVKQSVVGGLVATVVMTMVMLIAPMMGMPKMMIGNMLASFMHFLAAVGWFMHLVIGVALAFVYVYLVRDRLHTPPVLRGMLFSLVPWFLMQIMVMPMMGMGIFGSKSPEPALMAIGALIGHLVYGLTLGWVARPVLTYEASQK